MSQRVQLDSLDNGGVGTGRRGGTDVADSSSQDRERKEEPWGGRRGTVESLSRLQESWLLGPHRAVAAFAQGKPCMQKDWVHFRKISPTRNLLLVSKYCFNEPH